MVNKISAILWLLMVWVCFGQAQGFPKPQPPLKNDIEQELYVIGNYPKVGDVFEVVYRIKLKEVNELHHYPKKMVEMGYTVVFYTSPVDSVMIISDREISVPVLNVGEWREFHAKLKITGRSKVIRVDALTRFKVARYFAGASINTPLYLLDPQTGQYGTREEYERGLSVEYRYDFIDGSFIGRYDHSRVSLEENRRIIRMMKEIEPALTDSLALLLHSEQYKVGVPKGTARWDSLNQRWNDRAVFEYYLRDGWLNAVGEGRLEDWQKNEKKKIQAEWKGGSGSKFFRADSNYHNNLCNSYWKTFDGYWKFKDHLYNKDQGLLADAIKKAVKGARAR
ncbi:MAG: hypothetical protein ACUVTF_05800, partial [bacterium]